MRAILATGSLTVGPVWNNTLEGAASRIGVGTLALTSRNVHCSCVLPYLLAEDNALKIVSKLLCFALFIALASCSGGAVPVVRDYTSGHPARHVNPQSVVARCPPDEPGCVGGGYGGGGGDGYGGGGGRPVWNYTAEQVCAQQGGRWIDASATENSVFKCSYPSTTSDYTGEVFGETDGTITCDMVFKLPAAAKPPTSIVVIEGLSTGGTTYATGVRIDGFGCVWYTVG
jgi:hypothetical protein